MAGRLSAATGSSGVSGVRGGSLGVTKPSKKSSMGGTFSGHGGIAHGAVVHAASLRMSYSCVSRGSGSARSESGRGGLLR